jgi:hypothetical protein
VKENNMAEKRAKRERKASKAAVALPKVETVLAAIIGANGCNFAYDHRDQGLNAVCKRVKAYMVTDGARLNVPEQAVEVVSAPINAYSEAVNKVYNMPNHTDADEAALATAKVAVITAMDIFIAENLANNMAWQAEDSVKVGFGFTHRSTAYRPAAVTHPIGQFTNNEPGRLKGKVHDENSERIAILDGQDSFDIYIEFDNKDGTFTIFQETYTTARPTIFLPPNCCNKKGMAKLRWRNKNPVKGPWSDSFPVFCILMAEMGNAPPNSSP